MRMLMMAAALALASVLAGVPSVGLSAQTLRIGLGEDPDLLDPTLARSYVGRIVFAAMRAKLVDVDRARALTPQLATEWPWIADNKALIMTLRPGVPFPDGEPFDAT